MSLTKPQQRLLDEVRTKGRVVKNGRARSQIEALEREGLVRCDWDLNIPFNGKTYWINTVVPVVNPGDNVAIVSPQGMLIPDCVVARVSSRWQSGIEVWLPTGPLQIVTYDRVRV